MYSPDPKKITTNFKVNDKGKGHLKVNSPQVHLPSQILQPPINTKQVNETKKYF